ncbi:PKD domain-containing protein [Thiorhodococcus mannitoliphagus]|uniref:PKD domain-containing protein n=1 Tax=Thiorhodococcus mannitoliphagus TaxID=329406 RepID=A0A6P1DZ47_9GAMM|nr:PKD domain-containing protein [Thiorhodococcus mannitoliphagus]NEX20984.1 PKD domain-containing protein [Thiorhodococcus mannitoliphagus]
MPHSKMPHSIKKPSWAVLMVLLSVCLGSGPAAAKSANDYGPAVDTYCQSLDGSAPFTSQGCQLCHLSSNYSTPKGSTWDWYGSGNFSPFCTGPVANRAPNGTITDPASNQQIAVGGTLIFQGTGSDPDGDSPLSYSWNFGVSTATGAGPHVVSYPNAGTYTTTLTVSDGALSDPTPATRTISVQAACAGADADGDGYYASGVNCGPLDCNDSDPAVNPGVVEICGDGIDNNCDGLNASCSAACLDNDGDGYSPDGGICGPEDCDDTDSNINPGAIEICDDRVDNDCDWAMDESDEECNGRDCLGENFPVSDLGLLISRDPSHDPAEPLDGLTVSGDIYVFIPEVSGITAVRYYLDENLYTSLSRAPWDLVKGGQPFDTRTLDNGWHSIRVEVDLSGQRTGDDDDDEDRDDRDDDRDRSYSRERDDDDDDDGERSARTQTTNASFLVENLSQNQAPSCAIDAPADNRTISEGEALDFAGTGADPDGNLPLTYAWSFGGAAAASSAEDPGAVTFNQAGSYQISFVVTDSAGLPCPEHATRWIRVEEQSGEDDFSAHAISTRYVKDGHEDDWKRRPDFCRTCHGADLRGTAASATFAARVWPSKERQPDGSRLKHYAKGDIVGCLECHRAPEDEDDDDRDDDDDDRDDGDRDDGDRDDDDRDRDRDD